MNRFLHHCSSTQLTDSLDEKHPKFENCSNALIKELLVKHAIPYFLQKLKVSGYTFISSSKPPSNGVNGCPSKDEISACESIRDKVINGYSYEDFDFIMALTQQSINDHFRQLWKTANKYDNGNGEHESESSPMHFPVRIQGHREYSFTSTFLAPMVQLRCEGGSRSVTLYITLEKGQFKPSSPEGQLQPE